MLPEERHLLLSVPLGHKGDADAAIGVLRLMNDGIGRTALRSPDEDVLRRNAMGDGGGDTVVVVVEAHRNPGILPGIGHEKHILE